MGSQEPAHPKLCESGRRAGTRAPRIFTCLRDALVTGPALGQGAYAFIGRFLLGRGPLCSQTLLLSSAAGAIQY